MFTALTGSSSETCFIKCTGINTLSFKINCGRWRRDWPTTPRVLWQKKNSDEGERNKKLMVCTCSFSPICSSRYQRLIYSNCSNVSTTLHNHQNTSLLNWILSFYSENTDYLFWTSLYNTLKTKEISVILC